MPISRNPLTATSALRALVLLTLLLFTLAPPTTASPLIPSPPRLLDSATLELYDAVVPALRPEVVAATAGLVDTYEITARIDPDTNAIVAHQRVTFVNHTQAPLDEVYFRLYPNADYYGEGELAIETIAVAGEAAPELDLLVDDTALRVPLPTTLPPGAATEIAIAFTTVVPTDSTGSFGILNRDSASGIWVLADWYPIVAGYEPHAGWYLDPPTSLGDPTFAETALYDVTVTAPAALTIVAAGSEIETRPAGGTVERRFVTGPMREFTLVAAHDYVPASAAVDGTTVTAYATPQNAAASRQALETATESLAAYGEWFGPYPFAELNLVQTPLAGALGVSWSGLIFLDLNRFPTVGALSDNQRETLEFLVAHEVGHQWWGGSVGANSNNHTFMVEGLTNYLSIVYIEWTAGEEAAQHQLDIRIVRPYAALLERGGDEIADIPVADGQDTGTRSAILYGKSALGFLAIRQEIGDDAFFAALADYAATHAFGIATPADLRAAFETASGQDLADLWRFWFEAAETTPADIEALLG